MRVVAALALATGLSACAPTITPQSVLNQPEGLTKTVRATVTPYFTATGTPRATYDIGSGAVTRTASNTNGVWAAEMPGSEALSQGTPVVVDWSVTYTPLLLPAPGTVTEQQTFTVGARPRVDVQANQICLRQGELLPVAVTLVPGGLTAQVSVEVIPASLAVPQVSPITVSSPQGNSVNVQGAQLGTGQLRASATNYDADEAPIRVIEATATPSLSAPPNGASGVFAGIAPSAGAVIIPVRLEWNAVPGALSGSQKYRIHYREGAGGWTFTNSSAEFIDLSFPPGAEISWKVSAQFNACPSGSSYGPESEVRTFTVWAPPQS